MRRTGRSPLLLMALTVFLDFAGFGLVIPLLPFWAEHLGANSWQVGLILTVYALAQFGFTPILGSLSDRYGRRPIIIASLLIEAVSFAFSALAGSLVLFLLSRLIGGIGASNIGSAQAVVADVTPPEGRARGMGAIGAAIGVGFVVGPAAGGALAAFGQAVPFWVAMVVALLNALLVLLFLPETRTMRAPAPETSHRPAALLTEWRQVLALPAVARLIGLNLLFTLAFTGMEAVFPLFTQNVFKWNAEQNGYIFTYVGVIIVVMQGGLVGQLVKRWGEQALFVAGLAFLAVGLALLPFGTSLPAMLIALAVLSIGDGAISPTSSALLSFASSSETQGATLGLAQSAGGLGRVVAPLAAGALFGGPLGIGAPFAIGAGLSALAALIAVPALPRVRQAAGMVSGGVAPAATDGTPAVPPAR